MAVRESSVHQMCRYSTSNRSLEVCIHHLFNYCFFFFSLSLLPVVVRVLAAASSFWCSSDANVERLMKGSHGGCCARVAPRNLLWVSIVWLPRAWEPAVSKQLQICLRNLTPAFKLMNKKRVYQQGAAVMCFHRVLGGCRESPKGNGSHMLLSAGFHKMANARGWVVLGAEELYMWLHGGAFSWGWNITGLLNVELVVISGVKTEERNLGAMVQEGGIISHLLNYTVKILIADCSYKCLFLFRPNRKKAVRLYSVAELTKQECINSEERSINEQ